MFSGIIIGTKRRCTCSEQENMSFLSGYRFILVLHFSIKEAAERTTNIVTLKCIVAQKLYCFYLSNYCNKESPSLRKSFQYTGSIVSMKGLSCMLGVHREDDRVHILLFKNSHTRFSDPGNPELSHSQVNIIVQHIAFRHILFFSDKASFNCFPRGTVIELQSDLSSCWV